MEDVKLCDENRDKGIDYEESVKTDDFSENENSKPIKIENIDKEITKTDEPTELSFETCKYIVENSQLLIKKSTLNENLQIQKM